MAVRIRLRRMGAKKQPTFRLVVADSRSPRDGRFIETIGFYNPRAEPAEIRIDREKALHWLNDGAVPSDSARSLLSKTGIWQEFRTGEAPEPRPTPATPAERTAPEPGVEEAPDEVATEIESTEEGESDHDEGAEEGDDSGGDAAPGEATEAAQPATDAAHTAESPVETEAEEDAETGDEPAAEEK